MSDIPQVITFEGKDIRSMSREELIEVVEWCHADMRRRLDDEMRRLQQVTDKFIRMGK